MKATWQYSLADEIKTRLSILDLVQQGLVPVENLRVRGDKATGCCPLHEDRNPSFGFSLSKNLWYCFTCAEGGDQIRLYARYHDISDKEAIQRLAAYLGLSRHLSPAEQEEARKQAKRREQERLVEGKLEAKIREVTHALADEVRTMERYLLVIRDAGKDPLQDSLCCDWLRKRDLIEYWLDQLTFGDAEAKIQTLLEVLRTSRFVRYLQWSCGSQDSNPFGGAAVARLTEALKKALDLEDEELFPEEPEKGEKPGRATQAQQIIDLALAAGIELFHTPDQVAYASIPVDGHIETWPLRKLRPWLSRLFYKKYRKPPGGQALQDALETLEAQALFDGPCYPVNTRIADPNGNIYIDLANDAWQAVEVSPSGWRVLDTSPVKFRRTKGMLPLPVPKRGGSLDLLREFVNVADDAQWVLLVSWLLSAFRPRGPYPVLLLQGEQGCAKSTTARVLKALVDPNISHLRTSPRDERDLLIAATNGWTLAFDNLSGIPDWLSDAFCRLSTGGGFATRQLYSDDEEVIFDAQRPVVLNGIDDLAWRHDLLDRAIVLNLPVIPESKRKSEAEFWGEFEEARPYILGAVLDVVAAGLRNLPNTKLDRLPRMADFALWVTACEEALPWPAGAFMEAYAGNRQEQIDSALENDPLAQAVKELLNQSGGSWEGTASDLLEALEEYVDERVQRSKSWPDSAKALGRRLKRSATFLRQAGIEVEFVRSGKKGERFIRIYYLADVLADVSDIMHFKMSANEASKIGYSDITDVSDINFSLESKNQKEKMPLDRVGNLTSEMSALSEARNDAGSKADISESKMSAIPVKCQPDQSTLWDTLLSAVDNERLRGLLEFARNCRAELVHSSKGWRIETREALGDEYSSWRQCMMSYVKELQSALAKLPPPEEFREVMNL